MEMMVILVIMLQYLVPIGAAIWLLRTVARIARTLDSVLHRLVTIEQALRDRDIG